MQLHDVEMEPEQAHLPCVLFDEVDSLCLCFTFGPLAALDRTCSTRSTS